MSSCVEIVQRIEDQPERLEEGYWEVLGIFDVGMMSGKRAGWVEFGCDFLCYLHDS
jgi:hypothetical protein